MVAPISDEKKREAIRLRVEERLSLDEIEKRLGISRGTLSPLLKEYPLTEEELHERRARGFNNLNKDRGKYTPVLSKFVAWIAGKRLSTDRKGQIAEAAVLLRLQVLEYQVLMPPENSRMDFVVTRPDADKLVRLQVKWARREKEGRPYVNLRNGEGKHIRRVSRATCDFVIGYDFETDTAFVIPITECDGKNAKSCDEQYAEAWHLLGF
ncbi:MAG: hypothetical protein HY741_19560 [Chloroflexi bacterium]|nr:hypothetical protein [Chloroflexota bacterium]